MTLSFVFGFIALVLIFDVFTTFELWRFISASRAGARVVAEYLFYLLPLVSVELFPGSVLVAALMTYALYTFSAENLPKSHSMMLTIPVVMYGLFRYLFLMREGDVGAAPEELLFRDRPLLLAVVVWALLAVTLLYLGRISGQ